MENIPNKIHFLIKEGNLVLDLQSKIEIPLEEVSNLEFRKSLNDLHFSLQTTAGLHLSFADSPEKKLSAPRKKRRGVLVKRKKINQGEEEFGA